jgi:hypothetical protein
MASGSSNNAASSREPVDNWAELYYTPEDEDGVCADDFTEPVRAVPLGADRFQLLETPVFSEDFTYGDVVTAHSDESGRLCIGAIQAKSDWRTWRAYSAPSVIVQSREFADLLNAVAEAGGKFQIDSGGFFSERMEFSFPPNSDFDPEPTLAAIFAAANAGTCTLEHPAQIRASPTERLHTP